MSQTSTIHYSNSSSENIRYIHTDYLGSWNTITGENGNPLQELSFDAWGNRRDPNTWRAFATTPAEPLFDRGFTGHEHLYGFQLINMNGRMYDPVVSRMLSPDNFIQAPDFSQSFNRYSYCWNNPLKYTDPSGEMVMFYALGLFITGSIIENAINYKDYCHKSEGDVIRGGYNQGMNAYNEIQSVTSFTVYQNENFSFSMGLSMTGLGLNANMGYRLRNFTLSVGGGINSVVNPEVSAQTGGSSFELVPQLSGGIGYDDGNFSLTYYQTYYGGMHKQRVGGVRVSSAEFSFRLENDFLAWQGEDRWRSNAVEISHKNFVIGTNLYNNDPEPGGMGTHNTPNLLGKLNKHDNEAWVDGQTYFSPLWLGIKQGNSIHRLGYSHPMVQDRSQNWVHRNGFFYLPFGRTHYFNKYAHFQYGLRGYSGFNNPYSLW
ncbi:MAG: polymorphic toxin type 23 domain-containing protein [Bacteroidales bacterium]|nr:polymorphic toxin type 23 domain-containing protein [Bacteroidales bacterium]